MALSVSISANKSPFLTVSPTFLCQAATTPSVMVSLKRGINITSAIGKKGCFVIRREITLKMFFFPAENAIL